MTPTDPPSVAVWLLEHVSHKNPSLTGDLLEEYQNGRSVAWLWRQVLRVLAADVLRAVGIVLGLIVLYRIGAYLQIPGPNGPALALLEHHRATGTAMLSQYDVETGRNLSFVTVLALGVVPFISASIVVQGILFAWWSLTRRGTPWQLPIVRTTWIVAVVFSLIQSAGLALFLERQANSSHGLPLVYTPAWGFRVLTMLTITAGSACLMWIGDRITERRLGNGLFLLFFAATLAGLPGSIDASGLSAALRHLVVPMAVVGITSYSYGRAFQEQHAR